MTDHLDCLRLKRGQSFLWHHMQCVIDLSGSLQQTRAMIKR